MLSALRSGGGDLIETARDVVINYDIKYRMGRDREAEGGE